ncbi:MAG: YkgJ family cysteine cluster protein, partial [Gallionellaceae bacterium]|nr:YkgJ family cysteine cluster protein [Gallionellaceae bacterium]
LYFMACYDVDRFREFVSAESFNRLFELPQEEKAVLLADDVAPLKFAFRFMRDVMFGEESIALNAEAAQVRLAKVQEKRLIEEREAAKKRALEAESDRVDDGE